MSQAKQEDIVVRENCSKQVYQTRHKNKYYLPGYK